MNFKRFTLALFITIFSCFSAFATDAEKSTNMGGEVDFYLEYSPIKNVTLFLGEEFYLNNFIVPEAPLFDATYTSVGVNYKPHPRIGLLGAYEFQYLNGGDMRHRLKLMVTPNIEFNDLTLSLRERFQMTYNMTDMSYSWLLRTRVRLDAFIPNTPLYPYVYVEMHNPLDANPACWYDCFGYGAGLDWVVDENNILGIYYEFSHSIDSYYHLLGVAYVLQFKQK